MLALQEIHHPRSHHYDAVDQLATLLESFYALEVHHLPYHPHPKQYTYVLSKLQRFKIKYSL